jgi:type I restriction enzyme, S subunit
MPAVDADSGAITQSVDRPYTEVSKGFTAFRDGDVIMAKITPCMENGKAAIARCLTSGLGFGSTEFHVLRPMERVLAEYVYYFIRQESFRQAAEMEMTGSVGQKRVPADFIENAEIPLPPLAEQKRIVEAIERLTARVDAARARLAAVPTILKRFRQAVLAAACSGRLTEDWRESHPSSLDALPRQLPSASVAKRRGRLWGGGEVPELTDDERESVPASWQWFKVAELGSSPETSVQIGPMSMKSSEFTDHGTVVLNVGCVQAGWIDESKCDHLPPDKAAGFARYSITPGDVLFTRSGTVGRCAVAEQRHDGHVMTFHLLRVRPDQARCLSQYLWAVFQGCPSIRRQTGEGQIGSTRGGFNTGLLSALDVPLPSLPEQAEIVRRVELLMKLADAIERRVAAAKARADKLTQSVLAKAFRGELVP